MEPITIFTIINGILLGVVGYFVRRLVKQFDEINKMNDERLSVVEKSLQEKLFIYLIVKSI
jgi:hypothetical protein